MTGRPRHNPDMVKGGTINMRVDPILAARVKASAAENGRSIACEVEERLRATFPRSIEQQLVELRTEEQRFSKLLFENRRMQSHLEAGLRAQARELHRLSDGARRRQTRAAMEACRARASELLAAEYEAAGENDMATLVRRGEPMESVTDVAVPLRAIAKALKRDKGK